MSQVRYAKLLPELDGIKKVRSIGSTDEAAFDVMCQLEDAIRLPDGFDLNAEPNQYLAYRASDNSIILMDKPVDPEEEAAKALAQAKVSCNRIILSVASLEAQTNVNGALAAGELDAADMALAAAFRAWVQDMRNAVPAVATGGAFPEPPVGVSDLMNKF